MFSVGQKVECIKQFEAAEFWPDEFRPVKGDIYVVGGFHPDADAIYLAGINNPRLYGRNSRPCAYLISHFRPIQEGKTDIGFAHEILRKVTKRKPFNATA